jgi:FKBP-type peptidyl-prolyl cis-trans isomerase SlyD
MTDKTEFSQVADGLVVTMDYTLTVDDQIMDSSAENGPIRFVQGSGEIIPGLERQLDGLALGEKRHITVSAEEGYGEFDADSLVDMPRAEFPESIPLELGVQLKMKDEDGSVLHARIFEITTDSVKLNLNHALAGKELQFDVAVVDLREATPAEMGHGQAH